MNVADLFDKCVTPFPTSSVRMSLYLKLEDMVQSLLREHIVCDVMIDGSFVTDKNDPLDVDVAVHISADFSETLTTQQRLLVDSINNGSYDPALDSYVETEYPRHHPEYPRWKEDKSWGEQWGIEHSKRWCKGVVVLRLWETNVGLRIRR